MDDRQRGVAIEEFEAPSGHRLVEVSEHGPDGIRSIQWREDDLEAVRETRLQRGQPMSLAAIEYNGEAWLERYERDREGRVAVIWEPENRCPPDGLGFRDHGRPLNVDYDELGRLQRVTALETHEIIYRAPPESIEALLTRTVLRLADDVRAQFAACPLPGPVSSLQFVYGDPSSWIPVAHYETKASRDERLACPARAVPTSLLPRPSEVADNEVPSPRGVDSGWMDDVHPWLDQELPLAGLNGTPQKSLPDSLGT